MAEMHDDVQERIVRAFENESYIECCWLCYACFESRVNRTMEKICPACPKPVRADGRHIGISTKLMCLNRLRRSEYPLFAGADLTEITNVMGWCKERNKLIHDLVSLGRYQGSDYEFKNLAKRGMALVERFYSSISVVRENYYGEEDLPAFDESIADKCNLKTRCLKEE